MTGAALLSDLGLVCPEGDALAVRAFADRLLQPVALGRDPREARLLLTALCLHLLADRGTPTVADLLAWLEAGRQRLDAFAVLRDSPMQLLAYAETEWLSLGADDRSLAIELCVVAAKLRSSEFSDITA